MKKPKKHKRNADADADADTDANADQPKGEALPTANGFLYTLDKPKLSTKVYQALCEGNMKAVADEVIAELTKPNVTKDVMWDALQAFRKPAGKRYDAKTYRKALAKLRIDWNVRDKIFPRRMTDSAPRVAKQTPSPGLPYMITHRGQSIDDILKERLPSIKRYWSRIGEHLPVNALPDCAAFAANDIVPIDSKEVRVTWTYPLNVAVEEGRYAFPLIDQLSQGKIGHRTGYGLEMMKGCMAWLDEHINKLNQVNDGSASELNPVNDGSANELNQVNDGSASELNQVYDGSAKILMVYYKHFESTLPAWMIRDVFYVIAEKTDFSHGEENDAERSLRRFRRVVQYFINTPVQNCDGRRMRKHHGVPPGSLFANVVTTACNGLIIDTLLAEVLGVEEHFLVTFGDNSVVVLPPEVNVDVLALAKRASDIFGVEIDAERTFWTTDPNEMRFFGYRNKNGLPIRIDDKDLIADLLYSRRRNERWTSCLKRAVCCLMACARPIMCSRVQSACLAVLMRAKNHGLDLETVLDKVRKSYRVRNTFATLGYDDLDYVCPDIFIFPTIAKPAEKCAKIRCNIDPVEEARKMRELVPDYVYPAACKDRIKNENDVENKFGKRIRKKNEKRKRREVGIFFELHS